MKRFIVDGQVFQTAAWHRGMGKYSLELLKSLQKEFSKDSTKLEIILSSRIESDPEMRATLSTELPGVMITELELLPDEVGNPKVPERNRQVIDQHLQGAPSSTIFLILSLMQGVIYPVFPSSGSIKKLLLFYDLIPLQFHDIYLRNNITRQEYLPRLGELLRADLHLAISKTVANDLAVYMGVDAHRVTSIDGGAIQHSDKEKPFNVPKPFILMPTGNDLRKNNRRAIIGFEEFNKAHDHAYNLVITSFFKEHEITELSALSADVIFSGNISGAELNYLYNKSEALLFPSEYEGLGMPILEAAERSKPIACSNIPVFREMSTKAFVSFDPYSSLEITAALEEVMTNKGVDQAEYDRLLKAYTWQHSAQKLLSAAASLEQVEATTRPALSIVTPNPAYTDVGSIVQDSHAELSRVFDINYSIASPGDNPEYRINYLPYNFSVSDIAPGIGSNIDGLPVYHIGDADHYADILFQALANPGIIVLYDVDISSAWHEMVRKKLISSERLQLEQQIDFVTGSDQFLGLSSLLTVQLAVVVFSEEAQKVVAQLAERLNLDIVCKLISKPVTSILYTDALPEKTISIKTSEDLNDASLITDYTRNNVLSKLKTLVCDTSSDNVTTLRAMSLGAVPCSSESKAKILLESQKKFSEAQSAAIKKVQTVHSELVFAKELHELVSLVTKTGKA